MAMMAAVADLSAAVRGEPFAGDEAGWERLIDAAVCHRVDAILAQRAAASGAPPSAAARLTIIAAGHGAVSAALDRELARVLGCLAAAGIDPVLIKGAHLAHAIYPSPALRPRGDTDLMIAEHERDAVAAHLESAGYRPLVHVRGRMILGQFHFARTDPTGVGHALDVHWRIAAPLVFRDVLPARVLRPSRTPIPSLGPHAWGPSRPHALLIACVHLAAHHRHDPLLLWLYDISRLAATFDDRDADAFVATAASTGVAAVCAHALDQARRPFDGAVLRSLAARVTEAARAALEPSARVLTAARPLDDVWLDLQVSNGWAERAALVREHVWPDAGYMRATHAAGTWLPLAYARRALLGAGKWLAPRTSK